MAIDSQFLSVSSKIDNSSWVYLVDWILALVLSISFVFYYNRLLGVLITQFLRITVWRKSGIKINIESIKLSPLGGRIFAKNVTIISPDQTISILNLTFTWKYWLFKLTRLSKYHLKKSDFESNNTSKFSNDNLPCRFSLIIDGLEIFIYNRSVAYETMMSIIEEEELNKSFNSGNFESYSSKNSQGIRYRSHKQQGSSNSTSSQSEKENNSIKNETQVIKDAGTGALSLAFILNFMPLNIEIKKGAIVMGNSTTPSILIASYKSASGCIDVSKASHILDYHRVLANLKYFSFQISMKSNIAYENHNSNLNNEVQTSSKVKSKYKHLYKFHQTLKKIEKFILGNTSKKENELNRAYTHWEGLKRYVEDQKGHNIVDIPGIEHEYARYTLILDSSVTSVNYFYDVPGINSNDLVSNKSGNPKCEIQVLLSKATIHYGPWADRQRIPLQNMFFPTLARDSKPTELLYIPGSLRQYEGIDFSILVEDELILRIPTKEPSKDIKQLISKTQNSSNNIYRPFGWFELKVGSGSKASYFNSFISDYENGWPNKFNADLNSLEIRSSVNHDVLFMADNHVMDFDIGFPLKWNGKCSWTLNNFSENVQLFFLRDHTMLISDLLDDFSYGPNVPYEYIRLSDYVINWKIDNYKIYLNVNDSNIINNPMDFSNNKYISFEGISLNSRIYIPLLQQLSRSTKIDYNLDTSFFDLILHTPPWDTTNAFLKDSKLMGRANNFNINGSYLFYNSVQVNTSNQIVINCIGDYVTLKFYGFLVKYLFVIRENYFGDHKHFQTFEEYNNNVNKKESDSVSLDIETNNKKNLQDEIDEHFDYWEIIKTENDIDLHFVFSIRHGLIVLPCNMYDTTSHIGLSFEFLDVDIRFNNYYMDFEADISPIISNNIDGEDNHDKIFNIPRYKEAYFDNNEYDLKINGLKIHSHRMFGLPPEETIYFAKWDFSCGAINISGDGSYLVALQRSLKNFAFGYSNLENGLNAEEPVVYDMTAVSFRCPQITLVINIENNEYSKAYLKVKLDSILANFDDITNERFSDKISTQIFKVIIEMDCDGKKLFFLETSLNFNNYCEKSNMVQKRLAQRKHMKLNDAPFHRLPFLLYENDRNREYSEALGCFKTSLTLPDINYPLNADSALEFYRDTWSDSDTSVASDMESSLRESRKLDDKNIPKYNYDIDNYIHDYEVKPEIEYNNFVVNLNTIKVFINPKVIVLFLKLKQSLQYFSIDEIMDNLHLEIINELKKLLNPASILDNFRVISSEIIVKFGELLEKDITHIFIKPSRVPLFTFRFLEPSLVFSNFENNGKLENFNEVTAAFHLKELFFSISRPSSFISPIHLYAKDIEFWSSKKSGDNLISSIIISDIKIDIRDSEILWLNEFLNHTWNLIDSIMSDFKELSHSNESNASLLVYYLTKAGEEFRIDDDPSVLTKPSSVLRSLGGQKDHVRFHESWKISARLRHILNNLPADYHTELNNTFNNTPWQSTSIAFEEVTQIFSRWRNWESNETERNAFFRKVFYEDNVDLLHAIIKFQILNLDLQIGIGSKLNNFIKLNDIDLTFKNEQNVYTSNSNADEDLSSNYNIVLNIDIYESEISTNLLDQIASLLITHRNFEKDTSISSGKNISISRTLQNEEYSAIININQISQRLFLHESYYELKVLNLTNSINLKSLASLDCNFCNGLKLELLNFNIWHEKFRMINLEVHEISAILNSKINNSESETLTLDVIFSSVNLKLFDTKGDLDLIDALVSIIEVDVAYINKLTEQDLPHQNMKLNEKKNNPNILINAEIQDLSWFIEPLSPLIIHGNISGFKFKMNWINGMGLLEFLFLRLNIEFNLEHTSIGRLENSNFENSLKFNLKKNLYMITNELNLGYTKLFIPQAVQILELILDYEKLLKSKLNKIDLILSKSKSKPIIEKSNEKEIKRYAIQFKFTNEYIGLSSFIDKTRVSFEIERLSFAISNVSDGLLVDEANLYYVTSFHGDLSIPTARISLLDRTIPVGISNILDINLSAKVLNDNDDSKLQSLQIESEYFRVCLNPQIVFKIVNLLDDFNSKLEKLNFKDHLLKSNEGKKDVANSAQINMNHIKFSTIHVLSYNFCVGWLFPDQNRHYPGIIFGAERFFAVTGENLGKFTLMGSYLSVANGTHSSNYFSKSSEKNNANRAYMPTMQFTYTMEQSEESKNMSITINGDELDVKFLSNSVMILEQAVLSGSQVQKFFNKREGPLVVKKERTTQNEYISSIHTLFAKLEIVAVFAGSNVQLYKISDDDNLLNTPPLNLHSPAVKIYSMYKHEKNSMKKNTFQCEILTSSSDNTLYASCVPVLMDIIESVQGLFKNMNNTNDHIATKDSKDLDIGNMLEDIDLHLGLRIEQQRLSLSCEPTAKVEAIVGIEGIYIQLNSNDEVDSSLVITMQLESLSAFLRHIYSREVSGSIGIKDIILSNSFKLGENSKILSVSSFSDIDGYINIKQYQDLDLFKDIWFPPSTSSKLSRVEEETMRIRSNAEIVSNKNISARWKEVSSTYTIPWVLTFLVRNVSLNVDFGQSLGKFELFIDRITAISNKASDSSQELQVGFNLIRLASQGRLSGNLDIADINLHSTISWNLLSDSPDIPIVSLNAEVGKLQLKAAFDFHVFAITNFEQYYIEVFNRKGEHNISRDHLNVIIKLTRSEVYITSLAASTFLDIFNTISRMIQDNKRSYREILRDSSKNKPTGGNLNKNTHETKVLNINKRLETKIELFTGNLLFQVYPSSFQDTKVFVVKLNESKIFFQRSEYTDGLSNEVDIKFNELSVLLSIKSSVSEEFIQQCSIDDFASSAREANGGTIFVFPSFKIFMKSFQKNKTNVIEYLYQSSFGGTVDIRWNLGSINFIREIYSIHSKALESRIEYNKQSITSLRKEDYINLENPNNETSHDLDQTLESKINSLQESKYSYVPLAPPIIEAPQLKDLGNATPPLEWFGLNRDKFPNMTHQFAIVSLNKVNQEIDYQYSKLLGKS